tara:strand:+ start:1717 stop:3246 length:1530 start_codon:yes stop_codon:yes gene_type:complete
MDEEQGLASPLAGGIRGIRRSVSSGVFTGRAVAPPPDPQVTSLLNQNSLTLTTVSGQLSNISAQVGSLNSSLGVIQQNLAISDQLDRQRESAKQKREAILAEQALREGKESQLERKIQSALLSPVRRVATFAQGILSRLGNFLLILAGGWLVDSTLNFLRLTSEGNVDALNKFKIQFFGTLALMTGVGALLTVGLGKIIALTGGIAATVLRVTFSGLIATPIRALLNFISKNIGQFRDNIVNAAKNFGKRAPKAIVEIIKKPVAALAGLALSIPLVGPLLKKTGKVIQKIPVIGNLFKGGAGKGAGTSIPGLTVLFETIGGIFDYRNRVGEDKDKDGIGGQTQTQAIAGAGSNVVTSLALFFGGLTLFPELGSSLVGVLGLGLLSSFAGDQVSGVMDQLTGANKSNNANAVEPSSENVVPEYEAVKSSENTSESITPKSNEKDVSQLRFTEDQNIVTFPLAAGGQGGDTGGEGNGKPAPGSSDSIPSIRSNDFANNFPALAGSMYNVEI